jgi:hypothetical protein
MAHEHYSARKHPEFVVLDIGEDVGALIIQADPELHGVEIEISPAEDDGRRTHKEVLERDAGGEPAYTAVFDQLPAGTYTLWSEGVARIRGVNVVGGQVVELNWPTPAPATA